MHIGSMASRVKRSISMGTQACWPLKWRTQSTRAWTWFNLATRSKKWHGKYYKKNMFGCFYVYNDGITRISDDKLYFRFFSVWLNRLRNKLLANYLRNRGNDLATVRISAFFVAMLSNNSFSYKYNIFFWQYELSAAILLKSSGKKRKSIFSSYVLS